MDNESELRADLQRYYGIDLDAAMNGAHTPHHLACLVEHLPPESSLHVAYNQDAVWTLTDTLLATLVNSLNLFIWSMGNKNKRGPRPQLIGPSYMRNKTRTLEAQAMPIDELMEKLNAPRG